MKSRKMETGIMEQLEGCKNCPFWINGNGCGRPTPIDECSVFNLEKETERERKNSHDERRYNTNF